MEYVGNILYDEKLKQADRKLIIFGAGIYGQKILRYLELNTLREKVICFCDSNAKSGRHYSINGIPVYQAKDVIKKYLDADYLVGGKYAKEMYCILKQEGIKRIHILIF